MAEELEADAQQHGLQGAGPILASVAAGAAAGAIAVVARRALSGGDDDGGGREQEEQGDGGAATSFDDLGRVADDLSGLVDELRSAAEGERDFRRLVEIADTISEYADQAANAFEAAAKGSDEGEEEESERRVTDDLMGRLEELTRGEHEQAAAR